MRSKRSAGGVLALMLMGLSAVTVDAGWPFSRKSNDCCPVCEQPQAKPKKNKLIGAEDAPASAVVDLVPARYTTVRAERKTEDKDTSAASDAEKMQELEKKLKQLDLKVNQLSLEIESLVHVLENPKK